MPHIVRSSGHQRIDGVSHGAFQEVSYHPVVRFQVADDRFNTGSFLELLPGLRLLIVTLTGNAGCRNANLGTANLLLPTVSPVRHRLFRRNPSDDRSVPDVQIPCDRHKGCHGTPMHSQSNRCRSSLSRSCSRTRTSCAPYPSICTKPPVHEGCTPYLYRCAPG